MRGTWGAITPSRCLSWDTSAFDLEADPACWVGVGFDYVHHHVPRAGLDEIARDHGIEPVGCYRFTVRDHDIVLAQLTRCVLPLIGSRVDLDISAASPVV
jgi:AraC family transcriptional regulator